MRRAARGMRREGELFTEQMHYIIVSSEMEVKLSFFFWNGLFDFNLQGKMLAGIVESFFF